MASATSGGCALLFRQRTLVEHREQLSHIAIDHEASGVKKLFGAPAAGEHANALHACTAGGDRVIRRVANGDSFIRPNTLQFVERGFEDVGRRLGVVNIVLRCFFLHETLDSRELHIRIKLVFLCRGGERDAQSGVGDALHEFGDAGQRPDQVQICSLEQVATIFGELVLHLLQLRLGHEFRNEFIAAFADLAAHVFIVRIKAEVAQRFLLGHRMDVDRIHQGAVDVEEHCLEHAASENEH